MILVEIINSRICPRDSNPKIVKLYTEKMKKDELSHRKRGKNKIAENMILVLIY